RPSLLRTRRCSSTTRSQSRRPRSPPIWPSSAASSEGRLAELSIVEAINDCFHVELERDPDVMVMGEDVGRAGGVFRATAGRLDDSPETSYVHTPGVKVAIPATPADAKGLLAAAIRDPDPVVVLEPKLHYRTMRGEVPDGEHVVPLGRARVAREGSELTIVA